MFTVSLVLCFPFVALDDHLDRTVIHFFDFIPVHPESALQSLIYYPIFSAYSFSGTQNVGQPLTPSDTHLAVNILEQRSAIPSLNEEAYQTSSEFVRHSPQLDTKWPYPASPTYPFLGVGSASPSHWITSTSVLLSPAPSSLGSSREELNLGETARLTTQPYPWPSPVWHCFQPGWYWLLVWLVWSLL